MAQGLGVLGVQKPKSSSVSGAGLRVEGGRARGGGMLVDGRGLRQGGRSTRAQVCRQWGRSEVMGGGEGERGGVLFAESREDMTTMRCSVSTQPQPARLASLPEPPLQLHLST